MVIRTKISKWLLFVAAPLLAPTSAHSQRPVLRGMPDSAAQMIAELEATDLGSDDGRALLYIAQRALSQAVRAYEAPVLDSIALYLEGIVLRSETERSAALAALAIMQAASAEEHPYTLNQERVALLFSGTQSYAAREQIILAAPSALPLPEAVAFLGNVSTSPAQRSADPNYHGEVAIGGAWQAIEVLARMGPPGAAKLRELHDGELVSDPEARAGLARLAAQGFTLRDTVRR